MFWFGEFLVLLAALVAISLVRRRVRSRWPLVSEYHLDAALILLLLLGLFVSAIIHVAEVRKSGNLELTVEALRDFSNIARLDVTGITGMAGSGLTESSPISRALEGAWVEKGGKRYPRCDDKSMSKFRSVTSISSRFPFAHYALAVCLRRRNDAQWKEHAHIAIEILEKTRKLAGHHLNHDQVYEQLTAYLSEASSR